MAKVDADGNEVYSGYTLVKPERKGDLWWIVNAAQTTVDSATTRSEARSAVKRILDNGPQSTATYCADTDGEHDYHPEDGGKRCNGCGYWVESLEPGEGYKPTVADPKPWPPRKKPKDVRAFKLHGGVAYGRVIENQRMRDQHTVPHDKVLVYVTKASRSPRFVGQYGIIATSDLLTDSQVQEIRNQVLLKRHERKGRVSWFLGG